MTTAATGPRVVCFGECMIELRSAGARLLRQGFAGDTCNTAIYLARLMRSERASVRYAMGVGSDLFAAPMRQAWRDEGVDDSLSRDVPGRSTGLYAIHVDPSGERQFSYWRDTSAARAYFDVPTTPLEEASDSIDWLYLSGISVAILPPAGRDRLLALMERLRARGATVVWDNNHRPRLWASVVEASATFERFSRASDIALLTLDDQQAVQPGLELDEVIAQAWALPCREVVVKRGASATLLRVAGEAPVEVPVWPVDRPVDTTAAGDSFAAAYLAARLRELAPARAVAVGNQLAATVIQHAGAIIANEAMPTDLWS
jgi:2-dehydro-3-deoxygluconokinase